VPAEPEWQAMDTLVASAQQQLGPVVAACAGCGQPMVASKPWPRVRWVIPTPRGELVCDERGAFHADGKALSVDTAVGWLQGAVPRPIDPDQRRMTWFEGALVLSMMAPVVLWVGTALFVALFLWRFELPEMP
jgi:hypothetical protein